MTASESLEDINACPSAFPFSSVERSSNPLVGCSTYLVGVSQKSGKRKADTEGEGPSMKKRRRSDLKEETCLSVDLLRG